MQETPDRGGAAAPDLCGIRTRTASRFVSICLESARCYRCRFGKVESSRFETNREAKRGSFLHGRGRGSLALPAFLFTQHHFDGRKLGASKLGSAQTRSAQTRPAQTRPLQT